MFKYLGEILEKFTTTQRVFVLVILVMGSLMVYIGPKYLEMRGVDVESFQKVIDRQRVINEKLNDEIIFLNDLVVENQRECTREFIKRERELYMKLTELERYINEVNRMSEVSTMRTLMMPPPEIDSDSINTVIIVESEPPVSTLMKSVTKEIKTLKDNLIITDTIPKKTEIKK